MNEADRELELLEQATLHATTHAALPALPRDDAELREGWTTLTQLVAKADAERPFDEQLFLAQISQSVTRSSRVPRRGWLLLLGTVAATVVCCAALAGYLAAQRWKADRDLAQGESVEPSHAVRREPSHIAPDIEQPEFHWNDTLDERIGNLSHTVYQFEAAAYSVDRSLQTLGVQVEQFGQDLEGGSL